MMEYEAPNAALKVCQLRRSDRQTGRTDEISQRGATKSAAGFQSF
jgi:hypothetical protein